MRAAVVYQAQETPRYAEFSEPSVSSEDQLITVRAAALSHLTRGRASGTHYSAAGTYPLVPGVDGVGTLDGGQRVYFALPRSPYGAMAERTVVPAANCVPVPDGLSDVAAAAIANPGMSSWAAFKERAQLKPGETVLINGATGTSGQLAVQIAKYLGAGKIIVTGRNPDTLESLIALGADATVPLIENDDELETAFKQQFAGGVDVVLDYLWGRSARMLLIAAAKASADGVPMRFVQIGSMTGQEISLPAAVLRSAAIEMMGSGFGSVTLQQLLGAIGGLFEATVTGDFKIAARAEPLSRVESVWNQRDGKDRVVFIP